jgi:starch phosphorylase
MLLSDYDSYLDCQAKVSGAYLDQEQWARRSILNVARCGHFSSDRAIREYSQHVWKVSPEPIETPR